VLDLEAIACHRSSVLGLIPGTPQPTQKAFDTQVWERPAWLQRRSPVFVEAESKKVGNLAVPDSLMAAMRASPCLRVDLSLENRVNLLLEDYAFFTQDRALFADRLERLTALRGKAVVQGWQERIERGEMREVVTELLSGHYDPGYETSTGNNFVHYAQAPLVTQRATAWRTCWLWRRSWCNPPDGRCQVLQAAGVDDSDALRALQCWHRLHHPRPRSRPQATGPICGRTWP
jgi:tRNA 2-selenouridine synthase